MKGWRIELPKVPQAERDKAAEIERRGLTAGEAYQLGYWAGANAPRECTDPNCKVVQ